MSREAAKLAVRERACCKYEQTPWDQSHPSGLWFLRGDKWRSEGYRSSHQYHQSPTLRA